MKNEEWDPLLEKAVNELGEKFDSHNVILELAHRNQRIYVSELAKINRTGLFRYYMRY